jgi:hypothetical protein
LAGTTNTKSAPRAELIMVSTLSRGRRVQSMVLLPKKGSVPPTLMKVRANMFVATATRGSTPNCNRAGMVISEVLPVTTLITLGQEEDGDERKQLKGGQARSLCQISRRLSGRRRACRATSTIWGGGRPPSFRGGVLDVSRASDERLLRPGKLAAKVSRVV